MKTKIHISTTPRAARRTQRAFTLVELLLVLVIPASLVFMYGKMVGSRRQALAVFANPVVPLRHTHAVADLPDVISRSEPRGLAQTRPPPRSVKVKN